MVMGPQRIERMDDRLDAIETALTAAMPGRVIQRELVHFDDHAPADISAGVIMIVSTGESNYNNDLGMEAKEGTQQILLIGHIKLPEESTSQAVEDAEINFIEELKGAIRTGVNGMSIALKQVSHSAQLEKPYGWFVASIDAGPPNENTI